MKCEHCYHGKVCKGSGIEIVADECEYFRDAKKMVELPCKVGDTVYSLSYNGIDEKTVVQLNIQFTDRIKHYSVITHNHRQACLCYENQDFGKTVFLTKEAAQKALEEGAK